MAWDRDRVVALAAEAQRALANVRIAVEWREVGLVPDSRHGPLAVLEVDVRTCPVRADRLASDAVVHHLSTVLSRPVACRNTRGVAYVVALEPRSRARLPNAAGLPDPPFPLAVPLGRGLAGDEWLRLAEMDALLVSGTTGYGKSTFLNAMLASLLSNHGPGELRVVLVDPKVVELSAWDEAPHLLCPVARDDPADAFGLLLGVIEERRSLFVRARARDLASFGERTGEALPRVLLVVDEVAEIGDLSPVQRIRATGRAFGVHAVLSTQYPNADTVASIVQANIPWRVSFWLPSSAFYRVALRASAGERFPQPEQKPGRMVAKTPRGYRLLQGFRLADEALEKKGLDVAAGRVGGCALSDAELRMVAWALANNGGYLGREEVMSALGLTRHHADKLAREWEAWGWLRKDRDENNKRRATDRLRAVAARCGRLQGMQEAE